MFKDLNSIFITGCSARGLNGNSSAVFALGTHTVFPKLSPSSHCFHVSNTLLNSPTRLDIHSLGPFGNKRFFSILKFMRAMVVCWHFGQIFGFLMLMGCKFLVPKMMLLLIWVLRMEAHFVLIYWLFWFCIRRKFLFGYKVDVRLIIHLYRSNHRTTFLTIWILFGSLGSTRKRIAASTRSKVIKFALTNFKIVATSIILFFHGVILPFNWCLETCDVVLWVISIVLFFFTF